MTTQLFVALFTTCPAVAAIIGIVIAAINILKNNKETIAAVISKIDDLKESEIEMLKVDKEDLIRINSHLISELQEERLLMKEILTKIDKVARK